MTKTPYLFAAMLLFCGCSLFNTHHQTVNVTTSETDANIYINGEYVGKGKVKKSVPRDETVSVMVKKKGFKPIKEEKSRVLSTTGMLDLIGGCVLILPFLGFISPGAWSVRQTNMSIVMERTNG